MGSRELENFRWPFLYSLNWQETASFASFALQDLPGIYQESTRNLPGVYQESTRNLPGIYQESTTWFGLYYLVARMPPARVRFWLGEVPKPERSTKVFVVPGDHDDHWLWSPRSLHEWLLAGSVCAFAKNGGLR